MYQKNFLLLSFLLISIIAPAQDAIQKLERNFNTFLGDPQTRYAMASVCVLDATTGKILYAKNEQTGLATASTLKVITSATAFNILGKDFQYETTLGYSGNIGADGVLKGNLMIIGGGDPTLGSPRYASSKESAVLNQWVQAIKLAGIKKVEGSVIGDDGAWNSQGTPDGWIWQDIGNYYGAASSALSWRENQFDIRLRANRNTGDVTILGTVPQMPYLNMVNELKAGAEGSGDQVYAYLPPLGNTVYLCGNWALRISKPAISAALPDPAYDAAFRLQDTLNKLGITVSEGANTNRQLKADKKQVPVVNQKLHSVKSPNLSQIVYWFNKKSVNLYGENLLRTLAWKAGKEASTKNGASVLINHWAAKGFDKNALNIMDGSGLSPATRVTTAAMAQVLFQSQKEPWFSDFYESLPENNGMKLKSGTISDVSAFAGYYYHSSGRKYIVVINVNNYSGSAINKKLFAVLDALK